jgi:hypothetical protein
MSVCLSVRYAFGHGTTKYTEILQGIPFQSEEGHDGVTPPPSPPVGVGEISPRLWCNESLQAIPFRPGEGQDGVNQSSPPGGEWNFTQVVKIENSLISNLYI